MPDPTDVCPCPDSLTVRYRAGPISHAFPVSWALTDAAENLVGFGTLEPPPCDPEPDVVVG